MHTLPVLQKFFFDSLTDIHAARRKSLAYAVDEVAQGAMVSITSMGRQLDGGSTTRIKHRVKRMDRLVGNHQLSLERLRYYQTMTHCLIAGQPTPVILIDWSDFSLDRQQQLLRASVPVGGRALTVYEELHPYHLLANRQVQHRFLDQIARILPQDCRPIIIADAGFRVPFYRHVETLGWHWIGRIRNRDFVQWEGAPMEWTSAKSLYPLATTKPQSLGGASWVRRAPLLGQLVLLRQPKVGRRDRTLDGHDRRSKLSQTHAQRAREPWLLVASRSLNDLTARQVVNLYKTRMQIEENFRDTKSTSRGLGIARHRHTNYDRAMNLLLIAAMASFLLWVVGTTAKHQGWERFIRVNSSSRSNDYSWLCLARLVIQFHSARLNPAAQVDACLSAKRYWKRLLG